MNRIKTDILIIGAGSGGLSVAAGAVQMGADVVLLEGHEMGGDCLKEKRKKRSKKTTKKKKEEKKKKKKRVRKKNKK